MAIFGLFLKSIFIVALLVAVFIIGVTVYLYMRVKRVARTFAGASGRQSTAGRRTDGARHDAGSGGNGAGSRSNGDQAFCNEELYDERSPRVANRKIFSKDDGEYVDFEEE